MQTIQFILALVIGWFLAVRDLSLPWIAIGIVAASSVLGFSPWWSNTGRFPRLRGAVTG
jgi:uncharacterized membrane protein AbrB (regulator of aidB expression)